MTRIEINEDCIVFSHPYARAGETADSNCARH